MAASGSCASLQNLPTRVGANLYDQPFELINAHRPYLDSGDLMLVNARAALHTDAQVALQTNARVALQTDVLVTPQTVVQDTPLSRRSLERDSSDQTRKNPYVHSVKIIPWQAAFLAGHLAVAPPDQLDQSKAYILQRLRQGVKVHQ
jgi:hypothetical protein